MKVRQVGVTVESWVQRWESPSGQNHQAGTSLRRVRCEVGGEGCVIAQVFCRKRGGWERPVISVIYMDGLLDTEEG